jgi:hypothetical protein
MRTFTAVIPAQPTLPPDLELLLAPVCANEPSAPDEYVGRTDGVLLDEQGCVVAFIVRLSKKLDSACQRTLVPSTAVTVTGGSLLHLSWTEDQLLAQPRLDEDLQPHNRVDGGPPVESQWMPARPNVVPPGPGANRKEAVKEGIEGGLLGATIGAIAGMAIGGPIGAASLAVFFAAGGSLAGVLSGASHDTAVEASEMKLDNLAPKHRPQPEIQRLEERLRDPVLAAAGIVTAMRISPLTTTKEVDEYVRPAAGWR